VQEALTNVARHAGASSARVCVRRVPGAVTIDVVDDGTATAAVGVGAVTGNGLRGMRERAAAVGGSLQAAPIDSGGWRVHALLPVDL
jgi:signal transduction histidine kinase